MTPARLPDGFRAVLDPDVQHLESADGAVLLGGAPPALLRLAPAAVALVHDGAVTVVDDRTAALARRLLDAGIALPHPPPAAPPAVTVVVPVRDNPAGLDRLLAALSRTAAPNRTIVVDDGSADAGAHGAVAREHGADVLRHPRSRGPAAARNTGLAAATTELVAFCDSDVVPEQDGWLDGLAAHLADPGVALAAPRITALPGPPGVLAAYERVRSSLDLGPRSAPIRPGTAVSYVPSAALVVRVAAVAPGFDEALRVAEDVDLVFRLDAAGWRCHYDASVRVAHEHRTAWRPWLARKAFYGTGAAPLARRHPGRVPPVRLAPWTAAACALLATQRRRTTVAALAVTAAATARLAAALAGPPALLTRPRRTAARLAVTGLAGAAWQLAAALVRHWWPAAAVAAAVSRRARRALVVAAVAEGLADWHRHGRPAGAAGYLLAHRLDDLAYGAGLWWGALRAGSAAALLPVLVRSPSGQRATRRPAGPAERGRTPVYRRSTGLVPLLRRRRWSRGSAAEPPIRGRLTRAGRGPNRS